MKGFVVALVVLTVVAAGAGGFFGMRFLVPPPAATSAPATEHAAKSDKHGGGHGGGHGETPAAKKPDSLKVIPLPAIVGNLAGDKPTWARIEASIVVDQEVKEVAALTAKIGEDIVAYLRTVTLQQTQGAAAFQALREDLTDRVRIRSNGAAKDFVIQGFVIE